jgi:F0F1-type ATP synthase alpha subunit
MKKIKITNNNYCFLQKNWNINQHNKDWADDFLKKKKFETLFKNKGIVLSIGDGIATVWGLFAVQAGELVRFNKSNLNKGMALNLEKK